MNAFEIEIEELLKNAAEIIMRYGRGTEISFYQRFKRVKKHILKKAWIDGTRRVKAEQIIDNPNDLSPKQIERAKNKYSQQYFDTGDLLQYLRSPFSKADFSQYYEKIERRNRCLWADNYLFRAENQIKQLLNEAGFFTNSKNLEIFRKAAVPTLILFFLLFLNLQKIIDGLTPVDVLSKKLHEQSRYEFSGSICNDGWVSHSQGQGACSWHDGVNYEFEKGDYRKTLEECEIEAKKRSWRD